MKAPWKARWKLIAQVIVVLLLAGTASLAAPSTADPVASRISFQPQAPTSRDRVSVLVTGLARGGCGDPALTSDFAGGVLRLALAPAACAPGQAPAPSRPFTATAEVGPLPTGAYAVQVLSGGAVEAAAILEVGRAESAAGAPGRSGVGMLAVIVLLALAGAALLR